MMVLALAAGQAWGQEGVDKRQYTLLNPTPREHLRPLAADRPDLTESPYTVDAGRVQVETSFIDYQRDKRDGVRTRTWTALESNIKLGLLHNVDLQFAFNAYAHERTTSAGMRDTARGFSDVQLRMKINVWGNDEGRTAFGVMPYLTIPTGTELSTDEFEGGFILMYEIELLEGMDLGFNTEFAAVYDDVDENHDFLFQYTTALGVDLIGDLGAYLEYVGIIISDSSESYQAILGTGLTYALSDDVMLDAGVNVGLNKAAPDLQVFTGITVRF